MASASVPHPSFVANTTIQPDEVNANFAALVDFFNNNVIQSDGSKAYDSGAIPSVDADCSADNQLARKHYVDARDAVVTALIPAKGVFNGTANFVSLCQVAHGLGTTPSGAVATIDGASTFGGALLHIVTESFDGTYVTFKVFNNGASYAGGGVKFNWLAWR